MSRSSSRRSRRRSRGSEGLGAGVPRAEVRKPREVTVRGPQLDDAVLEAEGGDASVAHFGADHTRTHQALLEGLEVRRGLGQEL